jgi:hypothetical protein
MYLYEESSRHLPQNGIEVRPDDEPELPVPPLEL